MTVQDVYNRIGELKPHKFSPRAVVGWISKVDAIIGNHHLPYGGSWADEPYDEEDMSAQVLLDEEWQDLYLYYAMAQMDMLNGDSARHINATVAYNTMLQDYLDFYNRTNAHVGAKIRTSVDGL